MTVEGDPVSVDPILEERAVLISDLQAAQDALAQFDSGDTVYAVGTVLVEPGYAVLTRMDHHPQMPDQPRFGWWVTFIQQDTGVGFWDSLDQFRADYQLAPDPLVVHTPGG